MNPKWGLFEWLCMFALAAMVVAAMGCTKVEEPPKYLTPKQISAIHEECKKLKLGTAYLRNRTGLTHVWCVPEAVYHHESYRERRG